MRFSYLLEFHVTNSAYIVKEIQFGSTLACNGYAPENHEL